MNRLFFSLIVSIFFIQEKSEAAILTKKDSVKSDAYYFVSNRFNAEGNYTMYKARTNQSGISSCLVKGNFEVEGFAHMRKAEIAVYNISNYELVGIYNTN